MKNEHSLNVHVSRYHNAGSVPSAVPCPVCRKTYSNQYSLRTHMHIQAQMLSTDIINVKAKIPPLSYILVQKSASWVLLESFCASAQGPIVSSGWEEAWSTSQAGRPWNICLDPFPTHVGPHGPPGHPHTRTAPPKGPSGQRIYPWSQCTQNKLSLP